MARKTQELALPAGLSELQHVIERLAVASQALSTSYCQVLFAVVEALQRASAESIALALEACTAQPILLPYSSDCTPAVLKRRIRSQAGSSRIHRTVQSSEEFLVQHILWSSYDIRGALFHRFYQVEPVGLRYGKTMNALLGVALDFPMMSKFPSSFGQVRIRHQVYDRAVSNGLVTAMSGFWNSSGEASKSDEEMEGSGQDSAWEWHAHTWCAAHDTHNALKWGHFQTFGDEMLMSNVWAGIAAYKFCCGYAIDAMHDWVCAVVVGKNPSQLPASETLSVLWTLLGAHADLIDVLASDIGLHWTGNELIVSSQFLERSDWLSVLSSCLMSLWEFQSFSTSRWLSTGGSCRSMLRGLLSGYTSQVQLLRSTGSVSEYYAGGTVKLGTREWNFIAVVGLSSFLPEAFLWRVLADGRVPLLLESMRFDVRSEFEHLENLGREVWSLLGSALKQDSIQLRSQVLSSAVVSWGFLDWRVLQPASSYPWRLLQGDVEENLQALRCMPDVESDGVTEKIQELLRIEFSPSLLRKSITLLGECIWTTSLTEKQHTGVAVTKRFHSELSRDVLCARAYMHVMRQMLPGQSPEQMQLERWQR